MKGKTVHFSCISQILKKSGVYWDSTCAIHTLHEGVLFSEEGGIVHNIRIRSGVQIR
jgi:hypothetical protein